MIGIIDKDGFRSAVIGARWTPYEIRLGFTFNGKFESFINRDKILVVHETTHKHAEIYRLRVWRIAVHIKKDLE